MRFTKRALFGLSGGILLVYYFIAASFWAPAWLTVGRCQGLCVRSTRQESRAADRGRRLVHELVSPLSVQSSCVKAHCCAAAHLDSIADMMAYFDALAEAKGQGFCEGTFVIEDHSGHLYAFLRSHAGTYRRISSHFGEYGVQQYGLDIPLNKRSELLFPRRKRHLLFGALDKGLLFIKPENYGTKVGIPTDFVMHAKEYVQYLSRRLLRIGFEQQDWREERIPTSIIKTWQHFLMQWLDDPQAIHEFLQVACTHGIKGIVASLERVEQSVASPTLIQHAARIQLEQALHSYDHCHLRRGREVILRVSELLGVIH